MKNVWDALTQSNAEEIATVDVVTPRQKKTTINNNVKGCVPSVASLFKNRRLVLDNNVKFTFAQVRYIVCLYRLSGGGYGIKNVELASALGFSKPSVHNMLKSLAELSIVKQEVFGLAFFTDEGRVLAQKYAVCYAKLEKEMTEICGKGAASENAICGLLADMPYDRLNELYHSNRNGKRG